jgi:hypothetical protein
MSTTFFASVAACEPPLDPVLDELEEVVLELELELLPQAARPNEAAIATIASHARRGPRAHTEDVICTSLLGRGNTCSPFP